MKNYMVNVVTSSHSGFPDKQIDDMDQVLLLQFGPCFLEEGNRLADTINAWIRGGEGRGPEDAFRNLGLNRRSGDVWASCDQIPSSGIAELQKKFGV